MKRIATALTILLVVAGAAQATTVELLLEANEGTWQLLATASPASISGTVYDDDNGGIAGFNIALEGVDAGSMVAPVGFDSTLFYTRGFSVGGGDVGAVNNKAFAGQNPSDQNAPGSLIYGIGQEPGSMTIFASGGTATINWGVPAVLFEGTYSGDELPWINPNGTNVNLFTVDGGLVTAPADEIVIIPEPATMGLLAMGALALIRRRR